MGPIKVAGSSTTFIGRTAHHQSIPKKGLQILIFSDLYSDTALSSCTT